MVLHAKSKASIASMKHENSVVFATKRFLTISKEALTIHLIPMRHTQQTFMSIRGRPESFRNPQMHWTFIWSRYSGRSRKK